MLSGINRVRFFNVGICRVLVKTYVYVFIYIYIVIRVIVKQVATSWDHHQSAYHHNHHHFVEWAAYSGQITYNFNFVYDLHN